VSASGRPIIEIAGLRKTYRVGFFMRPVEAVKGVSFTVNEGEIVGLIGPNGSGKTSTIKVLLGLCAPSAGSAKMFGLDARDRRARENVGFLPENPYVYPYLTPREFIDLCARLSSVDSAKRAKRVEEVMARTGIAWAADRRVGSLSKGMLQRTGLAAALVADPQLLVLDEPMSGLDPLGRREVRDLIFEERRLGRTVLFSSHVLGDVEALCDRVIILRKGEVLVAGVINELVRRSAKLTELTLRAATDETRKAIAGSAQILRAVGDELVLEVEGDETLHAVIERAMATGARIASAVPKKDTLEDLFVRQALRSGDDVPDAQAAGPNDLA
jgi:ABC-2 type transport system ATP-binding protein